MNRKLIAIDLDGTLLTHLKKITKKNKEIILKAQQKGHVVMIATGRPLETSLKYAKSLRIDKFSGIVATYNGAVVTDIKNNKELFNIKFEIGLLREIISFIDDLKVDYSIMKDNILYTNHHSKFWVRLYRKLTGQEVIKNEYFSKNIDFTANKILLNDTQKYLRITKKLLEEKFGDLINVCFSSPVSIEVMPKGATKGDAMLKIADKFNISHEDTIAIGNTGNDETMIKSAHIGVCVSNGSKSLKNIADVVTEKNYKSGVGKFIEKYILSGE